QAVISRSITEDPRPLTRTRPSLPPQIDAITMKALAKSPADRYQTAADFAAALAGAAAATTTVIDASPRPILKPWMSIAAALLIVALGAASIKLFGGPGAASARQVRSVAVLPFANQGAAEDAYFADGIVDEVRTRLARLDKFTVIASASADEYRDSDKQPIDIARELRVDQVLMGTVRWATDGDGTRRFRVNTELVDGSTGNVTWRDSFDGDLSDPFGVQGQIATRVASALGTVLADKQVQDLAGRPTTSAEAYDAYLKGKAITDNSAPSARLAATNYERAVALDSTFAQAWAALAGAMTLA